MPLTASLKTLIGMVCLGLTVALSVASLAITLSTASEAIEGIAQDYVSASVARTTALIENHFQASVVGLQFVQNWVARQNMSAPAAVRKQKTGSIHTIDPNEGIEWMDIFIGLHRQGQLKRENQLGAAFSDGTVYVVGKLVSLPGLLGTFRGQREASEKQGPINALFNLYATAPPTTQDPNGLLLVDGGPLHWADPPRSITARYDLPNATMFPRPGMLYWADLEHFLNLSLTLFGPMYNAVGQLLGYVYIDMPVDIFDSVLQAFPRPDGANVFLVSNDGRVMASTIGKGAVQTIRGEETASYAGDLAHDCLQEEVPPGSNQTVEAAFVCVQHALTYHPTLATLWRNGQLQGTRTSAYIGLQDGMYVGIQPINTVSQEQATIPNMNWKVVVLYEAAVVHKGLRRGQNISIGVVVAIAVVCLALAMTVIHVVMKPLEVVAEDMERVATMQNLSDTTAPELSHLEEVYSVQQSFAALKNHLVLIRSYLPHTLLVKLDRGENPDDFGTASEDELEESLSSIASVESHAVASSFGTPTPDQPRASTVDPDLQSCSSSVTASSISGPQTPASKQHSNNASRQNSFAQRSRMRLLSVLPGEAASTSERVGRPSIQGIVAARKHLLRWTDVRRSQRMSVHAHTPVPPIGAAKLVTRKKATILAVNIRDFHAGTGDGFAQQYELITQQLYDVVVDNGGAIVTFSGDHFVISFNAVTPVGSHCQHACKTAVALRKLFEYNDGAVRSALSAGIATGAVIVGNFGCQDMKKAQVIGPVYTQATICERLCKLYPGVNILSTKAVERDACGFVEFQNVDIVDLPKARRCVISAVMDMKQAGAADEWMYQMQDSEDKSPYAAINRGFELYMAGDTEQARRLLGATPQEPGELVGLTQLRSLLSNHPDTGRTYVNELTTFFAHCML